MKNRTEVSVNAEVTIQSLKPSINKALSECRSNPGWKFSVNSCPELKYAPRAMVTGPQPAHIAYHLDEPGVPQVIRDIVIREYELAHKGVSDIAINDEAPVSAEKEAVLV